MREIVKSVAEIAKAWPVLAPFALAAFAWLSAKYATLPAWVPFGLSGLAVLLFVFGLGFAAWRYRRMPLKVAARKWYEASEGSLLAHAAHRMSEDKSAEAKLDFAATHLLLFVELYARCPPSTKVRHIDRQIAKRGTLAGGCERWESQDNYDPTLVDLHVSRWEFLRKRTLVSFPHRSKPGGAD